MVTLKIRIATAQSAHDEAVATLLALAGPVRAQPGCTATRVLALLDEDRSLAFEAEWRSQQDLERHLLTPAFRTLLAAMELAIRTPAFEVDIVDRRLGFEFVEVVLGAREPTPGGAPQVSHSAA